MLYQPRKNFLLTFLAILPIIVYCQSVVSPNPSPNPCLTNELIINTGYNHDNGGTYNIGGIDPNWIVISDANRNGAGNLVNTIEPRPGNIIESYLCDPSTDYLCDPSISTCCGKCSDNSGGWIAPQNLSQWISALPSNTNDVNGIPYIFQFCFCLNENFSNVVLDFNVAVDDRIDFYLNGNLMGSANSFRCLKNFNESDQSKFKVGVNCIVAHLLNLGGTVMGFNLAGTIKSDGLDIYTKNMGCCQPSTILGKKWNDVNKNGTQETDELEIQNWTINLSNASGILETKTTDVNGSYYFNVMPGYYVVTEGELTDWVQTFPSIGEYILNVGENEVIKDKNFGNVFSPGLNIECEDCITSFAPVPNEKYVLSAWVRETVSEGIIQYNNPSIYLNYNLGTIIQGPFKAKGAIIDGWQRIEEEFTVPADAGEITVQLKNEGSGDIFFDDIRIHPFKSNMKSFVYDPVTQRLMAEMDENHYATFYEYDEEGALIRVKKETERGIKTIKESGNNTRKK